VQILSRLSKKEFDSIAKLGSSDIIERIKQSGLRGRSGSNFPTGLKWEMTTNSPGKKVLICNADEGEPGAFKDKFIFENNLDLVLQGIEIGRMALDAECFIYLRGEYECLREKIEKRINALGFAIKVVTGAGAYICGEETALMESIEGNRGNPRNKPPYPTASGLWKRPTCVNNVETLVTIPLILSGKFDPRLRLFSLSGEIKNPGVYEIPIGSKLGDIAKVAGADKVNAICLGYAGGIIPYERFRDLLVDDKSFSENSFFIGPGSMIFLNMDIVKVVKNISEFFVHESCGKCIPCREGGLRILEIISKIDEGNADKNDLGELEELCEYMGICFCPLGRSYGFVIGNALKNFRKDFDCKLR
jgi:NADH:ubiquinone oxidoreductase subunit F (NADH-binding)